jgi:hypothetical protein
VTRALTTWFVVLVVGLLAGVLFGLVSPIWALRIGAMAGVALTAYAAVTDVLSRFDRPERPRRRLRRRRTRRRSPAFLARVEGRFEAAGATAAGYEPLRRRLQVIAEHRLARHGLRLTSDGARRLLGDETWTLLQEPDREQRFNRGPSHAALRRLIARLEEL